MTADFQSGVLEVEVEPGEIVTAPLPRRFAEMGMQIRRVTIDVETDEMLLVLPGGAEAIVELGITGPRALDPLAGRRIVYLDQNEWSTLAGALYHWPRISAGEQAAARALADLVKQGEIVLPMSAGNAVETGRLHSERRVQVASTMIELSRGWQLRNPVDVRREELLAALASEPPIASGMASLGADVLFTQRLREVDVSDLPEPMAAALPRLVNVSSIYESLLEPEVIPDEGGRAAAAGWVQQFATKSAELHEAGASAIATRRVAHEAVLTDLAPEIARLASAQELQAWLLRADADVAAMPYLSRYREVIFARLRNTGSRWEGNDLIDLNYLCCAAGYAHLVVGESRTIGEMRTARGTPQGALLATSLAEAVSLLR
jgi:hypothetical protein